MRNSEFGGAIEVLRTARGLTQRELASRAGISQGLLSKIESGLSNFDDERLPVIAEVLEVPLNYFNLPAIDQDARIFHRKQSSMPIKVDKRIRAEASMMQSQVAGLFESNLLPLNLRREVLDDESLFTPGDVARHVRSDWGLGDGPIDNLVATLEAAGVIVTVRDLGTTQLDAIATWPAAGRPVIMLNQGAPGDRQRFTLAHEIGHAVLHDFPAEGQEREADEFASELLMPASAMRVELRDTSLENLVRLKLRWRVSMAALARRARDLGLMSDAHYRNFNVHMSASGMRRQEPVPILPERPEYAARWVETQVSIGRSPEEMARSAGMHVVEFRERFMEDKNV
ncbi:helix-turn-helix domain-containing protein [Herbiconiux liukaitaii]|uniref:helix-turn-helix domain-containing protein n=1 Tax=Herbiconiux liukaitaii TaxID=3342799 RepID=UPI0035BB52D7